MKKGLIIMLICGCMIGVSACGNQKTHGETKVNSMPAEENVTNIVADRIETDGLSNEEMLDKFYEQFYSGISNEEIEERVMDRTSYYCASVYYEIATKYWENVREVKDIANRIEPLYFTDMKYYIEEEFQNVPPEIIHLAKNEIYARHGYIFKDEDLLNYFMGCAWYQSTYSSEEFSDSVFNDYEKHNLELLIGLDK